MDILGAAAGLALMVERQWLHTLFRARPQEVRS